MSASSRLTPPETLATSYRNTHTHTPFCQYPQKTQPEKARALQTGGGLGHEPQPLLRVLLTMPASGCGIGEAPGTSLQTQLEDTGYLPIPLNQGEGH